MPIMCAAKPRSNTTRSPLRRSAAAMAVFPLQNWLRHAGSAWPAPDYGRDG
jgi:hypothetical protein